MQRYSFVTFHQSYGYEEFVEGLRPVLNGDADAGEVEYEIRPGAFKELCRKARQAPDQRFAMVIDEINRGNISKIFGELITLIEADNYHALQLLDYLYAGQVDCIYIDPPYNTGARDWKYNNDYVDGNDGWRHSKWLAFMEKRLKLAKRLLKPDTGVLIVTIDEKEYLHLGMLLEQQFPEARIQMISTMINATPLPRLAARARHGIMGSDSI